MSEPKLILEEYVLVIDTDSFSEDFVDDLTAYCTGFSSENYVETKYLDLFEEANPKNIFEDYITDQQLEDTLSPCSIWLNRNWGVNSEGEFAKLTEENYQDYSFPAPFSVGIFFDQEPTNEQIDLIKIRSKEFFELDKKVQLEGIRLIKYTKYAEEKVLD